MIETLTGMGVMVLLIDNYDSFLITFINILELLTRYKTCYKTDEMTIAEIEQDQTILDRETERCRYCGEVIEHFKDKKPIFWSVSGAAGNMWEVFGGIITYAKNVDACLKPVTIHIANIVYI